MARDHHENVVSNLDIGVRFYESNVTTSGYVPFHWHSSIELVCVMQGELTFKFDGRSQTIGPNQFEIISSGVVHDVTNGPNRAFVLQIPLKFVERYCDNPDRLNFEVRNPHSATYQRIVALFIKLNEISRQKAAGYLFDCGIVLLMMIKSLVLDFTDPKQPLAEDTSSLKEIIVYINDHYNKQLSVQQLAQRFGYNPSYLSRLFKKQTGVTLIQYIYEIRLSALYQDLIKTNQSISNLLSKHGLTNQRTAREMFKHMYGLLPNEVRQQKG